MKLNAIVNRAAFLKAAACTTPALVLIAGARPAFAAMQPMTSAPTIRSTIVSCGWRTR